MRKTLSSVCLLSLVACAAGGGGEDGESGLPSFPTEDTDPPDEVMRADTPPLSDRDATGNAGLAYILLNGVTVENSDSVSIRFSDGAISGGVLNGLDITDEAFANPADGEFSRVFRISDNNLFGVVGADVLAGDLPVDGLTDYNEGWVGMQAIFEDQTLTLEGDAEFTADWSGNLDGRFFNLSGTDAADSEVRNIGTIILRDATITDDQFAGGRATGTGAFARLDRNSSTNGTGGIFFGPQADELGGVLMIDDRDADIRAIGAFQAD